MKLTHTVVLEVLAVGHELLEAGGNHWCFYMVTGPETSVRIDVTPSGAAGTKILGGLKANIIIRSLPYITSKQAQHKSTMAVSGGAVVGQFVDAITKAGREKYEFNAQGTGCRGWTADQIDLFLEHGLVTNRAEAEAAKEDMLSEYAKGKPTGRKYGLCRGAYY